VYSAGIDWWEMSWMSLSCHVFSCHHLWALPQKKEYKVPIGTGFLPELSLLMRPERCQTSRLKYCDWALSTEDEEDYAILTQNPYKSVHIQSNYTTLINVNIMKTPLKQKGLALCMHLVYECIDLSRTFILQSLS
jgi:hypothetical protein